MKDEMKIFGIILISALSAFILPTGEKRMRTLIAITAIVGAALFSASEIGECIGYIRALGVENETLEPLLGILATVLICEVSSLVCRDMGENGIAESVQLVGRVRVLVLTLPLLKQLVAICIGFTE